MPTYQVAWNQPALRKQLTHAHHHVAEPDELIIMPDLKQHAEHLGAHKDHLRLYEAQTARMVRQAETKGLSVAAEQGEL